ncbi:FAD-dependent oxidoreductase [Aureitalea sp. L0-47]|uniref:NAD(P)/FAD-dependent oxidoreductase n=1 Tax=Aureitalea sp. L0-47 TaxID=2816962 RepID=UPI0022386255|nr:FAD-dependent oxidoreductase [Aureitalea sp. L0-47]MCW5519380.1 FAD-dependent oxidoreductase [Aureitalea sp. L0-47]
MNKKYDIIIIGGGLAGLSAALHLQKLGVDVLVIEKQAYPKHKVCGEYVSNEILPYLNFLNIDPMAEGAVAIDQFEMSTKTGELIKSSLPLGGFGISRYALDKMMYDEVIKNSEVIIDSATSISLKNEIFTVTTQRNEKFKSRFVVGAFGKRSLIDKQMNRKFISERTHWMAVKAHYNYDFPANKVALHNFEGGYCGLSKTESGSVNACYLATLQSFQKSGGISDFQKNVMSRNPILKEFFSEAEMLFDKPLSISQISFSKKTAVENHVIMLGDSAGLIHPLCGNGMAMAIHSAKLFSELFKKIIIDEESERAVLEKAYQKAWKKAFAERMRTGSMLQRVLLNNTASDYAYRIINRFPSIIPRIIRKTHGELVA